MTQTQSQQNIIKAFFRSEITWIIFIIGSVWGIVETVILPIQALQINVAKVQEQLQNEAGRYIIYDGRIAELEKNQAVVLSKLNINKQ